MATRPATERILSLAASQRLVRPRDVEALGIAREFLLRLYRQGLLVRPALGSASGPFFCCTCRVRTGQRLERFMKGHAKLPARSDILPVVPGTL